MGRYEEIYRQSRQDPEGFWGAAAESVFWYQKWDRVLDDSNVPFYQWFTGGLTNTCYNAVDRHVEAGRGDQLALIHDSPATDSITKFTYRALLEKIAAFAGVLKARGIGYGDRVVVYMPMVPEAAIAMLACSRIGAVHSVVFGGFAPQEARDSHRRCQAEGDRDGVGGHRGPASDSVQALLDEAISLANHKVESVVVLQRPQVQAELQEGRDVEWHEAHRGVEPADCVPSKRSDPCYILYNPERPVSQRVVRATGGHIVALQWSMKNIYNVDPGEVYWAASDVAGSWATPISCTGRSFRGARRSCTRASQIGTPDAGAFWRVIAEHGVSTMFTAPTAIRAISQARSGRRLDRKVRLVEISGRSFSPANGATPTAEVVSRKVASAGGRPLVADGDGWAIASNCLGDRGASRQAGRRPGRCRVGRADSGSRRTADGRQRRRAPS